MSFVTRLCTFTALAFAMFSVMAAENPRIHARDIGSDRFISGDQVAVSTDIAGDVFAAGRAVDLNSSVNGDVLAAGKEVDFRGTAQQNVFLAGGQVSVTGRVNGNLRAAGGKVILQPNAHVERGASIAGNEIDIFGDIGGYLLASAGRVYINGAINGDVSVAGANIELGPKARIAGKLSYVSRNGLKRDVQARVLGGVEQSEVIRADDSRVVKPGHWIWYAGLAVLAAAWLAWLPDLSRRCSATATKQWGWSLLTGLLAFVFAPLVVLICLLTVIGIPIGLIAFFAMPALLIMGYVTGNIAVGDVLRARFKPDRLDNATRIKMTLIATVLLAFVTAVPFLGGLVAVALLFTGFGALLRTLFATLRAERLHA